MRNKQNLKTGRLLVTALWMALILAFVNIPQVGEITGINVQAEEITVSGKVDSRTTGSMLYLTNSEGTYVIKIDSTTGIAGTVSNGKTVKVTVQRGNDGYLHATKIIADSSQPVVQNQTGSSNASVDASTATTVTGEVAKDSTDSVLRLSTSGGIMQIKLDSSTNMGGIRVLTQGRKVQISVARGSDGYLHAISIADTSSAESVAKKYNISGTVISGTITGDTTNSVLCVSNNDGTYKIKIDSSSDVSACRAMVKGRKVTVGFNYQNDGYVHATMAVAEAEEKKSATVDTSSTFSVSGKVGADTTENMLCLVNKEGTYKIKIDTSTTFGCNTIVYDQTITVSAARGNDGYIHALRIDDGNSSSGSYAPSATVDGVRKIGDSLSISGTVASGTTDSILYLSTSGGKMTIKIDSNADFGNAKTLMENDSVTATIYPASDAYYHVSALANSSQPGSASVSSSGVTVIGTVKSGTTGSLLYLQTESGEMKIKLNASTQMGSCKVLTKDKKVKVSIGRSTDDYWHAVAIDKG